MVTQWEYKVEDLRTSKLQDTLAELGREGWELVSTVQQMRTSYDDAVHKVGMRIESGPTTFIFKRPLRQTHPVGPYAGSEPRDVPEF